MAINEKGVKIQQSIADTEFNGVVLIEKDGETLFASGFGYANFEHDIPLTFHTPMRIASITKQFTAVAILQLYEKGLLKLIDTINKYIPDYPNGDKITIHHLLTHTSGISNFALEQDFYDVLNAESVRDALIDLFKYKELQFEPGSKFAYSISGFLILGYIIEHITKMTYVDYLKKHIFEPLGLENTGYDYYQDIIKNRANAYVKKDGNIKNADFIDMQIAGAGGGLYSSAEDIGKFNTALQSNRIISKEFVELMFSRQFTIDEEGVYSGYGIFIQHSGYHGKVRTKQYHMGGGIGVRSVNMYFPDDKVNVLAISNVDDRETFGEVTEKLECIMLE